MLKFFPFGCNLLLDDCLFLSVLSAWKPCNQHYNFHCFSSFLDDHLTFLSCILDSCIGKEGWKLQPPPQREISSFESSLIQRYPQKIIKLHNCILSFNHNLSKRYTSANLIFVIRQPSWSHQGTPSSLWRFAINMVKRPWPGDQILPLGLLLYQFKTINQHSDKSLMLQSSCGNFPLGSPLKILVK